MSIATCAECGWVRPPNARYCPQCGTSYRNGSRTPAPQASAAPSPRAREWSPSLWDAIKFGFGFALGSALFGLLVFVLLASVLGTALRQFGP